MNNMTVDSPVLLSLESILEDPTSGLFNEFATFLTQSYCIENLYFWLATQEYHQSFYNSNNEIKTAQLCESMIGLYIRPNSPQEINIPCDMRQSILDFYHTGNHHLHIFDDAAEAVLELMRVNSFLPWVTSQQQPSSNNSSWSSSSSSAFTPTTTVMSNSFSSSSSTTTSSTSTSTTITKKQHKSWPLPSSASTRNNKLLNTNLSSSTSLTGLSSAAFSITDKWNLKHKLNKQNSRKSCSSLDIFMMIKDDQGILSASSVSSSQSIVVADKSNSTRYRSMLNRVKKSLLGGGGSTDDLSVSSPLNQRSFTETAEDTTFWRKSQR